VGLLMGASLAWRAGVLRLFPRDVQRTPFFQRLCKAMTS
jgi:hypothetical protein